MKKYAAKFSKANDIYFAKILDFQKYRSIKRFLLDRKQVNYSQTVY